VTQEKENFYYFVLVHITALSLVMSGCATQSKSIGLCGAIGAGTGAVLGGIADLGEELPRWPKHAGMSFKEK
jgi:hypothetical protein